MARSTRKIRFRFAYPLGDHVVFGGALRELQRSHPGQFDIEVESPLADFWTYFSNIRHVRSAPAAPGADPAGPPPFLSCADGDVQQIDVDANFFRNANNRPIHMLQSLVDGINQRLGTQIDVREFRGEAPLSAGEMTSQDPVEALLGRRVPYWIICNGGKFDRTVKWWPTKNYQRVVSELRDRILFVQVGRSRDYHPRLEGTLDLRGWTDVRTLMRLVYHADGVVCPITSLMHLSAAIPRPAGTAGPRPCVIIGGGIEPPHWTAYPGQRFLSVVGGLPCAKEPCWKSRTLTLGDGSTRDGEGALCAKVIERFPACMQMIRSSDVVRAINGYIDGGMTRTVNAEESRIARMWFPKIGGHALDDSSVGKLTARLAIEEKTGTVLRQKPLTGKGRGIVTIVCGADFLASAWVMLRLQRHLGCTLPAEVWLMRDRHWLPTVRRHFAKLGAKVRFYSPQTRLSPGKSPIFAAKPAVINASRFQEVLWIDADSFPACDPTHLFDSPEYRDRGAILWPEPAGFVSTKPEAWAMFGLPADRETSECQGGELLFDKARVSPALRLALWCNQYRRTFYRVFMGDKDIFRFAFRKTGIPYAMPGQRSVLREGCLFQTDFENRPLFQHRVATKLKLGEPLRAVSGFKHHDLCQRFLEEFSVSIAPELQPVPEQEKDVARETASVLKIQ